MLEQAPQWQLNPKMFLNPGNNLDADSRTLMRVDLETAMGKKVQGTSPAKAKNGYGGPSLFTPASRWKMNVKITMAMNRWGSSQNPPSRVCP